MTTLDASRHDLASPFAAPAAEQAAPVGSSFYLGLRILPREQRLAMSAVYAFCRAVDDVADNDDPAEERLKRLGPWKEAIADLYAGREPASLGALNGAVRRFGLDRADFESIVAGMAMDIRGETVMPTRATLDLYCDRVASAPGRLSVRVFGLDHEAGQGLARHLGQALQLTNILRDIDEDAILGRLYLPREAVTDAGIAALPMDRMLADPRLSGVCAALAGEAREHFRQADRIMDICPRERVRAPRLMAAAYRPVLERLIGRGWSPPRFRIAKRKRDLMGAVLRFGIL